MLALDDTSQLATSKNKKNINSLIQYKALREKRNN